nr:S-layer homology domain-containing protein [Ammoniphilus resinae]
MENWREYFAAQQQQQQQPQPQSTDGLHKAYVAGYPNGQFKPSAQINRAEMAALLSRVYTGAQTKSNVVSYPDVNQGHWAKEAIQAAQLTGLMSGYPDQTFGPGKSITRAEMAAVVARWLQLGGTSTSNSSDVKGHWAEKVIAQVEKAKIMLGMPDGTFRPNQPLTRAEAVTIYNRILKRGPLSGVEQPTWKDVPATHWAFKEIEEASQDHRFTKTNGKEKLVK